MASFASGAVTVTFDVDSSSYRAQRAARVAVQEIPGGDTFYVDRAGRRPMFVTFGLLLPSATAWGQLNSVVNGSGTLTVELVDPHVATLMDVSAPSPELDGRQRADAEFLITDI